MKGAHPLLDRPTKSKRMGRIHLSKAVEILNNQFVNRNRQTTMMSYKEIERKRLYEKR